VNEYLLILFLTTLKKYYEAKITERRFLSFGINLKEKNCPE
jgi:hypothetical protein